MRVIVRNNKTGFVQKIDRPLSKDGRQQLGAFVKKQIGLN
jgi:hypothetical protein